MFEKESIRDACRRSPTPYHFVEFAKELLLASGFVEIRDEVPADFQKYFSVSNTSILAVNKADGGDSIVLTSSTRTAALRLANMDKFEIINPPKRPHRSYMERNLAIAGALEYNDQYGKRQVMLTKDLDVAALMVNKETKPRPIEGIKLNKLAARFATDMMTLCGGFIVAHHLYIVDARAAEFSGVDGSILCGDMSTVAAHVALQAFVSCNRSCALVVSNVSPDDAWISRLLNGVRGNVLHVGSHDAGENSPISVGDGVGIVVGERVNDILAAKEVEKVARTVGLDVKRISVAEEKCDPVTVTVGVVGGHVTRVVVPVLSQQSLRQTVVVDDLSSLSALVRRVCDSPHQLCQL